MRLNPVVLSFALMITGLPLFAQTGRPVPAAASAPTVVPALVLYADVAVAGDGKPLTGEMTATFLLFTSESGGDPLWMESQRVTMDAAGHYRVQLGAGSSSGMPLTVFASGEARWLEVQIAGQTPQARVLLSSVPYAAKAADAATLGGLPASAFMRVGSAAVTASATNAVVPDTASTVTTTGGTTGYLPVYSGATTIDDSVVFQSGTRIGIGTKAPAATLDIEGAIIGRGLLTLESTGAATTTAGKDSQALEFMASAYSSSLKKAETEAFSMQAEPATNNTSAPAATLNFLYGASGATPTETGLSISSKGIVKFATGQTFPGAGGGSGTITGVTASTGLSGGGTTGDVTLKNTGILAVTAGTGLKTTGGQSPTLTVDTTKVPTLTGGPTFTTTSSSGAALIAKGTNGGTGIMATSDTGFAGEFLVANGAASAIYANSTASSGGTTMYAGATGTDSKSFYASSSGAGGLAIYGVVGETGDSNGNKPTGVLGQSTGSGVGVTGMAGDSGIAVQGLATNGTGVSGETNNGFGGTFLATGDNSFGGTFAVVGKNSIAGAFDAFGAGSTAIEATQDFAGETAIDATAVSGMAVYGVDSAASDTGVVFRDGYYGSIWGDSNISEATDNFIGAIVGTTDAATAGFFSNNGPYATLLLDNQSGGGTQLFRTLKATSPDGTCGIGGGNLTCTGQMKSLASMDGGARKVETYAMQSPENWMEDFGSGGLSGGVATVSIDAAFVETANTGEEYHVFLTPHGDSKGLYVDALTATSFVVHESGAGSSSVRFDYRIVAKRRGFETQRLADVTEAYAAEVEAPARKWAMMRAAGVRRSPVRRPMARPAIRPGRAPQPPVVRPTVVAAQSTAPAGK